MPVELRDYQKDLRARVLQAFNDGYRRVLIVSPTGSGKGTTSSDIIESTARAGNHCLFIVNRQEIVKDQSRRLDKLGVDHGVIMAGHPRRRPGALVHVASKDTLQNRVKPKTDLIFIDEAHFAVSDGWTKILDAYPDTYVIGMTATPIRLDGRGMGDKFDIIIEGPTVRELQEMRDPVTGMPYLVRTRVFAAPIPSEMKSVKKTGGDFNEGALAAVCDKPRLVGDIVDHWLRLAEGKPTVVFAVNREHSEHIRDKFLEMGVPAVAVDANTSSEDRDATWRKLRAGEIKVVCSVGIVSYGWDEPCCSVAILARPTLSLALYLQQVGRVLRPFPGKEYALILDHAGNTLKHGFVEDPREWSLEGEPKKKKAKDEEEGLGVVMCMACWLAYSSDEEKCPNCGAPKPMRASTPKVADGELKEMVRTVPDILALDAKLAAMSDPKKREEYLRLKELCRTAERKAWKPAAAAIIFKKTFNHYPPKDWLNTTKAVAAKEVQDQTS